VEPGYRLVLPGIEEDDGTDDDTEGLGTTIPVATLDRLIATASKAADAYLILGIAGGLVSVGLLLGLVLVPQLDVVGAIGGAATAVIAMASVALMVSERECLGALQAGKARMLRSSSKSTRRTESPEASPPESQV
jgi:hypothetical protein